MSLDVARKRSNSRLPVALLRYISAMATVQIRDLPEASYEILRRRARQNGQSLQAYLRDQLVEMTSRLTKAEAMDRIEARLARPDAPTVSVESILEDLRSSPR